MRCSSVLSFVSVCLCTLVITPLKDGSHLLAQSPTSCQGTLGYLASQIPATGNAQLDAMRDRILATDIRDVMSKISAQGVSVATAIVQANTQAATFAANLSQIEGSIRAAASSEDANAIIAGLKARDYKNVPFGDDALGAADKTYVAYDWGQLANSETAKQMRCLQ